MRYGYLDDENCEYVITNPRAPVKWINYVGSREFGGIVDHASGALICKEDPALNRITRGWRLDEIPPLAADAVSVARTVRT